MMIKVYAVVSGEGQKPRREALLARVFYMRGPAYSSISAIGPSYESFWVTSDRMRARSLLQLRAGCARVTIARQSDDFVREVLVLSEH